MYVDNSVTLYDPDHATILQCQGDFVTYSYKILAKDNIGNRSLKSERGLVSGNEINCSGEDDSWAISNNENQNVTPTEYSMKQNYPNPFNPSTIISYDLPYDNFVSIVVYDISGKEVANLINEFKTAGRYSVSFSATGVGSNLSSGIYFYRIKAGNYIQTRKMLLLKKYHMIPTEN